MRLFVALEIPGAILDEIGGLMARLRPELPAARWVRPEGIHLTLVFLGETGGDLLDPLVRRLEAVFALRAPFSLRVEGAGTFPPGRPARVAWVGVEAPPALFDLHAAVAAAAGEVAGIESDRRPYHPHLTLARPRRPWPRSAVERFVAAADRPWGEAFEVEGGVLFESRLHPDGARYRPVATFPLEGRA